MLKLELVIGLAFFASMATATFVLECSDVYSKRQCDMAIDQWGDKCRYDFRTSKIAIEGCVPDDRDRNTLRSVGYKGSRSTRNMLTEKQLFSIQVGIISIFLVAVAIVTIYYKTYVRAPKASDYRRIAEGKAAGPGLGQPGRLAELFIPASARGGIHAKEPEAAMA